MMQLLHVTYRRQVICYGSTLLLLWGNTLYSACTNLPFYLPKTQSSWLAAAKARGWVSDKWEGKHAQQIQTFAQRHAPVAAARSLNIARGQSSRQQQHLKAGIGRPAADAKAKVAEEAPPSALAVSLTHRLSHFQSIQQQARQQLHQQQCWQHV